MTGAHRRGGTAPGDGGGGGATEEPLGFRSVAAADPRRPAIVEPGLRTLTYGELLSRVDQVSHALRAAGLGHEDVVASMLPNRREYHELRLATGQTGLYFTPISHHLTAPEMAYILRDSGARLLVVDASLADVVQAALAEAGGIPPERVVVVDAGDRIPGWAGHDYEDWLGRFGTAAPAGLTAGDYLGYTSGTTGRPKAVRKPLTGRPPGLSPTVVGFMGRLGIRPGREVHLVGSPLYHAAPGTFSTIALGLGHTVVITERPRPAELLALIEEHRVSVLFTVPTVLGRWLRLPETIRTAHDLSSLVSVVHAGAPCPPEVKRACIDWLGPVVAEFYGATEGSVTAVTAAEWLRKPGTVGHPIPGVQMHVLDEEGAERPPGEVGLVYYRPAVPVSYLNAPEKTAAASRGDLITTGDLGHVDDDGWLFLADRRTDLILSGGVNIYPAEVEGALAGSPDVADVVVIGVPDDDWGQRVVAVVQLEEGAGDATAAVPRIEAHARRVLAGFKVPREFRLVDQLPRTETGKVQRQRIRAEYEASAGDAVQGGVAR